MRALLLALLLAACPSATEEPAPTPTPVDYDPVRFIAIGDTGEGNQAQYDVAAVIETVCADQGCDFVLLLGDNIYDVGVTMLNDAQWQEKFELPYANIDLPFYAVLGNHDYGNLTPDEERADFQVAYTDVSDKWMMPARHYHHAHSNVDFYGIDTQAMNFPGALADEFDAQEQWIQDQFAEASDNWRIVYGHHPYRSNGLHGNAGNYDGFPPEYDVSGIRLKERFDETVCGQADLYLCGHDHDREWMEETCDGTELIVSGAGAKLRDIDDTQPVHWNDDQDEGFVWFEIDDDRLTLQFWDRYGVMNYEGGWDR